jgi:hypothetical protein
MRRGIFILFAAIFVFALWTESTQAIPAFGRKYRLSCQTCHSPFPRLKPYGEDFAGNGFQLEDQEAPRYYLPTGDEKLDLIRDFPLAVRLEGHVTYKDQNSQQNLDEGQSDFQTPYLMKLLSGGAISDKLAYYFYFYMSERGEVAGVEDAYLMYNNLFGTELDIMAGQFQVSDPLFKRELRLTLEDYELYTSEVGLSDVTLKYDRGLMLTYGFETGTDVVVEIVNGNGIPEADEYHNFDGDQFKNYLGRVSQSIGEYFRVGAFGYYGQEKQLNENAPAVNQAEIENTITIWGPDATINLDDIVTLNMQYTMRTDDNVYRSAVAPAPNEDIKTEGALAELIYTPNRDESDWYAVGLFNYVNSDYSELNYKSVAAHIGYLIKRNVRFVGEVSYNYSVSNDEYTQFSVGFITAM